MKTKLHVVFMLLLFCSFMPHAFATDYYTASANATLAGNSGAVNANWTTSPDGTTGLGPVAISATDNLIILNGGVATVTAAMTINALTINSGGTIIHLSGTSNNFTVSGLLTWNGTIKTTNGGFFNANGNIAGNTAIHDAASTRAIYLGGDGLRTINLIQTAGVVNTSLAGMQLVKNHMLTGNCKWFDAFNFNANATLDLAGYNLEASSIQGGTATKLIKGNAASNLTVGTTKASVIFLDPAAKVLNSLSINNQLWPGNSAVTVGTDLMINSLLDFGVLTIATTRILQVNGNFTLADNGTLHMRSGGPTAGTNCDQLSTTGNISLGASTILNVDFVNSYGPTNLPFLTFIKSTSPGTVSGTFGTVQTTVGFTGNVSYTPNTVQYQVFSSPPLPPPPPPCPVNLTPDLPLVASNATVEAEIETIVQRYSDSYLGTREPTAAALDAAIASYNALNIEVSGYAISAGTAVTNYSQVSFLKTFAQYLKFHPEDTNNIYTKALNTVWLVSDRVCKGSLALDYNEYDYRNFACPAILIPRIKDNIYVKGLFDNVLFQQNNFDYIWEPQRSDFMNVDLIGNSGAVTMAYVKWIDSADERYRYMTAFKREMEKFMSYTAGTNDGIKPDGSGFHHQAAYPSYMYDLNAEANIINLLRETSFQVNRESYLRLRDALIAQLMMTNDNTSRFLTMGGRKPVEVATTISRYNFRDMAVAGGSVLGTGTSDPVMATLYNRLWGEYGPFDNGTVAPFNEGYFQFNHSMAGIYRKNGWLAVCKGFNDNMLGSEIFATENRYGRYQSYGAVNIIYPGDALTGNGYDVTTWDWNFTPGATVIRLPWDKLAGEYDRIDELQKKKFVGSLSFVNKKGEYLKAIQGTYGLFAMDFQETKANGWGTSYYPDNHNPSFVFKKSVFTFDNMLICLGSGIGNNDATNTTLTTLYQRKASAGKEDVNVDSNLLQGSSYSNSYVDTANHWLVDNYGTGFYVFAGSGTIKLTRADQQTPQHSQVRPINISANPIGNYAIGYLDHGTAPSNQGYEYVCMPTATAGDMTTLGSQIDAGNKPYTVHRKDEMAHIVEYKPTATSNSIFGYAFFSALSGINNTGQLTGADYPCLVMSQYDSTQKTLKMAVNNPDLGFTWRSYAPSVTKLINITIKGTNWQISQPNANASITGTANGETTIQFIAIDGLPVEIVLSRVLTPQTIGFDALPVKNATDAAFDLKATASSGLPVSYTSSNTEVATVSGSTVTIVGKGTSTITAKQDGDDIYGAATAVEQILRVNTEPTVSITSPAANASYNALATITITADANDVDGSVSKVEFFNGTTKLGEVLTAPYSFDWNNVTSGSYLLTVKATDNDGAVTTSSEVSVNVICPFVQLSIPDVYAMNPAIDDANTIYLGYGPTSLTLNSLVQSDQDFTYNWSTGANTPSISVSQAGTYTVTVSYAGGCQSTASITINTLDVRCGNNNDKVMICHNDKVICVAQSAVQSHLNHGDNLGSCNGTANTGNTADATNTSNFTVSPNPVQDNFNASISSKLDPNATIGIYNILGNMIRQVRFTNVPQNVYTGDLPFGNYIIVVQNGFETFRSTIVKR